MRMEACTRTYIRTAHSIQISARHAYVNGQVGISIKMSDVYCCYCVVYEDKLPNPIGFPYIFLAITRFFCAGRLFS